VPQSDTDAHRGRQHTGSSTITNLDSDADAYPDAHEYLDEHGNQHAHAYADQYAYEHAYRADRRSHQHADVQSHADPFSDANGDSNIYAYANTAQPDRHVDALRDADADGHPVFGDGLHDANACHGHQFRRS